MRRKLTSCTALTAAGLVLAPSVLASGLKGVTAQPSVPIDMAPYYVAPAVLSLRVWPAAGFPLMAKNSGAGLVIINNEPTEQDDIADLVIRHDIGETLGPFVGN